MYQQPPSNGSNGQQSNMQNQHYYNPYPPQQQYGSSYHHPHSPHEKKQGYGFVISTIVLIVLLLISICINFFIYIKFTLSDNQYDPVATVNSVDIDEEQLLLSLYDSYPDIIIDEIDYLIRNEVVDQEAAANGIKVTEADLNDELSSVKIEYGSEEDFEEYLSYYEMTEEEYKQSLIFSTKIRLLLQSKVNVSEQEIQSYFDQHKNVIGVSQEKIRASQIVVDDYDLAEDIVKQLNNGASFIKLAQQYSTDYTADEGGDLGYITYDYLLDELSEAAFALNINEISPIISTYEGYHIILKTDYLKPIPAQYDDVKRGIEISLINQRIDEKYPSYIDDLIDKANLMSIIDEYYENGYFDNYYYDEYYDYSDDIFSNPVLRSFEIN